MLLIYNLLFPLAFLFFIPGMIYKLIRRPGHKQTYLERFAIFSAEQKAKLSACQGGIWIHSVSVGETMIALSLIEKWRKQNPELKIVLSTTTTTGQELARNKVMADVPVFYCPIDFILFVKKALSLIKPSLLVIFETELWPNMICASRKSGARVVLVNGRMSDKSYRGYSKFKLFFGPLLSQFNDICVQSEMDGKRFSGIAADVPVHVSGNLKFDQSIPDKLPSIPLVDYFGTGEFLYLVAASTHPGEEKLISDTFLELKKQVPQLRLIIVPRHVERVGEIEQDLKAVGICYYRKTQVGKPAEPVECLLADTTGEMLGFMNQADIVIMGKSLAGHDEGHNLIEPSLLAKPVVTGSVLRNFRYVLSILKEADALETVDDDSKLNEILLNLINDKEKRLALGNRARQVIEKETGATDRVINVLEKQLI